MGIEIQVNVKTYAHKVIDSCETLDQCQSAGKYIDRYETQYEDVLGTQELRFALDDKEEELLTN